MRKSLLTTILALVLPAAVLAQGVPWRNARYDGFKTHEITTESIVFFGNSITNMHEWWEAFDNPNIVNRGVNGAETPMMRQNLEAILAGHPAKLFIMMGTNDLGTSGMNSPAFVANSVRTTLKRCRKESPSTKVYVQSILPCQNTTIKKNTDVPITNDSIKNICENEFPEVTYIDLYSDLMGIQTGSPYISYDGTHLTMAGYRVWCNKIAQYVGSSCVYSTSATDNNCGLSGIAGMRATYFSALPIKSTDVVILGDDSNDYHELLSSRIKQRGGSWGYQSNTISMLSSMLPGIFNGRTDNAEPAAVCVALGYNEATGSTAIASIASSYRAFIKKLRTYVPNAPLKLMAIYPSATASTNTGRIVPLNDSIAKIATEFTGATYVGDSYTQLVSGTTINSSFFSSSYMQGKGFARLSQVYAEALKDILPEVKSTSDADAASRIQMFDARTTLYNAIAAADEMSVGDGVGQYTAANFAPLSTAVDEGYALLADASTELSAFSSKATELAAAVKTVLPTINRPQASTADSEVWYQLYTPNRNSRYMTSNGAGSGLTGGDNTLKKNTMWKFVLRSDGTTYDIINRADGSYINPSASYDAQVTTLATQPTSGWTLSNANVPGVFNISSGTVELNEAGTKGIVNWSSARDGKDGDDLGCQYAIVLAPDPVEEPKSTFTQGDETISLATGAYAVPTQVYNKTWTSTRTLPQITFTCPANNMEKSGDYIVLHTGTAGSATYTINVGSGYTILGYHFTVVNVSGKTSNISLTGSGQSLSTSTTEQLFEVTDLSSQTTSFTISGDNGTGIILKDFVVTIKNNDYDPTTAIQAAPTTPTLPATIYDLQGRRVQQPTKGIYIVGGRKVLY